MTIWAAVEGYEGAYEVSDEGVIRSVARQMLCKGRWGQALMSVPAKTMRQYALPAGYMAVRLSKNGIGRHHLAHRLVARAFIGPSDLQVNHKDGVKTNNHVSNLEYCTASENLLHCTRVLGKKVGEKNGASKLTQVQVDAIKVDTRILRLIAADYGVTLQAIHHIKKGRNWAGHAVKLRAIKEAA